VTMTTISKYPSDNDKETVCEDDDNYKVLLSHKRTYFVKPGIPNSRILLDCKSMVDMLCNSRLLSNIGDSKRTLTLYYNAGKAIVIKKGDLKGYRTVWNHPDGMANI